MTRRMSRRRLLRTVAIGGVTGAAFLASEATRPTVAEAYWPPCDDDPIWVPVRVTDTARKQVGGLVITYVPAPLNARGTIQWTITNTRTMAVRISSAVSETLSIKAEPTLPPLSGGGVSISSSSTTLKQGLSLQVAHALSLKFTESQGLATSGRDGLATVDDTAFLILGRPTVQVQVIGERLVPKARQPCSGTLHAKPQPPEWTNEATFQFVDGGTIMPRTVRELRQDPATRGFIGAQTVDNILTTYPLLANTSGRALGLGQPRFTFVRSISPGAPPYSFSDAVSVDRSTSASASLTIGAETTTTTQFGSGTNAQKFSDTLGVNVTVTGTQEESSTTTVTASGTLTSDQNRLNYIYRDNVFNTLLITDEGPLSGAAVAVAGTVTGTDGTPVAGAVVTLQEPGGAEHVVVADALGRYEVRTFARLAPGSYRVVSGGQARTVTVGRRGTAGADIAGIDPARATRPTLRR